MADKRIFVVADASVQYKRSARLDDALTVTAGLESVGRVRLVFIQSVLRGEELLCSGRFVIGSVNSESMKPAAITEALRNKCMAVGKITTD